MAKKKEFEPDYVDIKPLDSILEVSDNYETKRIGKYLGKFPSWTPPYATYWDYYYDSSWSVMVFYTEDWRI